ncbi:MAG: putative esterase YcpF (UPF0227 family) [Cellvibrionaceae bacterium]|jgi:predicted esterase YcpF (UPF0227 family)
MASLLYIHGFLSSPMSAKAQSMQQWLKLHRPDIAYYCPQLPPYPKPCATILDALISAITSDTGDKPKLPIYVMGSSLGGFWATWLAECYRLQAVLINPAVDIDKLMPSYLNVELKNYHHADTYRLDEKDFNDLLSFQRGKLANLENYWLLAQTGDETLDYRLAQERYKGCHQTIEQGGDHSFQNFENFIPQIINFFENKSVK